MRLLQRPAARRIALPPPDVQRHMPKGTGAAKATRSVRGEGRSMTERPDLLAPDLDGIPVELRERAQWVIWRQEERDGRWTKVPYQARHPARKASSTEASTWATFEEAW